MKVMQEFQKQSAQMDMTVRNFRPLLNRMIAPNKKRTCVVFLGISHACDGCLCVRLWQSTCACMHWLCLLFVQNEMMSDSIDNILDDDQAEEETDELANQVI
jgi:hypothetical protein